MQKSHFLKGNCALGYMFTQIWDVFSNFLISGLLQNRLSLVQKFQNRNTNSYFPQKPSKKIACSWNTLFHANFGLLYKKNYDEKAKSCSFCMSEGQIIFVYILKYTQLLNPNVC